MTNKSTPTNFNKESNQEKGDHPNLQDIYSTYYNRLLLYGCSIENDRNLVHDVIQDLFIWMIRNSDSSDKIKNVETYLYKSIRRNVRSSAAKTRQKKMKDMSYSSEKEESITSRQSQIIEEESKQLQNKWLRDRLDKLSSHQREIIYLRFFEQKDYSEIASIYDVSQQVARNAVFRAMKELRKDVGDTELLLLIPLYFLLDFTQEYQSLFVAGIDL